MNKKKIINDPIYGFITIHHDIVFDCIQLPEFQRLRRIKQLGLTNQFSGGVRTEFLPAPRLGENTVEIMQEFGFTTEEIETAVEQKAVFKFV